MFPFRSGSRLDGLRMKYGDVYSDWHGGGGGGAHTCEWDADDRVIIVQVGQYTYILNSTRL